MSLQINTNVAAINAQRNLSVTNRELGGLFEQLSSGLRVNRAADDAAGLAISEKMRAQVRGMRQGGRNAQDGISMLQTAEGALNEVHSILQRVRELAVQAGNTTLSQNDRRAIGEELVALRSELDNIANRTRFNGQQLLTGALSVQVDEGATTIPGAIAAVDVTSIDVSDAKPNATYSFSGNANELTLRYDDGSGLVQEETIAVADLADGESQQLRFAALGITVNLAHDGAGAQVDGDAIVTGLAGEAIGTSGSSSARFRVGSEIGDDITLTFDDMRATALGGENTIASLITDNDAVASITLADDLLTAADTAIDQVSTFRAKLGASQNQMETAVNSLAVAVENLSASESRIRDADIASVSSEMVSRQIMQQAGISVLAQANTTPQAVLALLQ